MAKQRKHYTAEEKVSILRQHLLEHVPASKLCDERSLQPTVFYRWQKEFFENGAAAFGRPTRSDKAPEHQQIAALERKLQRRNEILARISHHLPTEARDRPAGTSLRLLAVLNVLSSTPALVKRHAPRTDGPRMHFASPRGEKSGLTALQQHSGS